MTQDKEQTVEQTAAHILDRHRELCNCDNSNGLCLMFVGIIGNALAFEQAKTSEALAEVARLQESLAIEVHASKHVSLLEAKVGKCREALDAQKVFWPSIKTRDCGTCKKCGTMTSSGMDRWCVNCAIAAAKSVLDELKEGEV